MCHKNLAAQRGTDAEYRYESLHFFHSEVVDGVPSSSVDNWSSLFFCANLLLSCIMEIFPKPPINCNLLRRLESRCFPA